MTFARLYDLLQFHNIPMDVKLTSDSGWECDATDMNEVFYNAKTNELVFTQKKDKGYMADIDWKLL